MIFIAYTGYRLNGTHGAIGDLKVFFSDLLRLFRHHSWRPTLLTKCTCEKYQGNNERVTCSQSLHCSSVIALQILMGMASAIVHLCMYYLSIVYTFLKSDLDGGLCMSAVCQRNFKWRPRERCY